MTRDAQWLYAWGEEWRLDERGWAVVQYGTPVFIVGQYEYSAPPPWRSPDWLAGKIELPPLPEVFSGKN